jgi:hypothetical protein
LIRFHFGADPDEMTDEQFAERWQELRWVLAFESKRFSLKDEETLEI